MNRTFETDNRRRYEYQIYISSYEMWKKTLSICKFLIEQTKLNNFNSMFIENVQSFIGELNGLLRFNNKHISRPINNKCINIVVPQLKNIINLYNSNSETKYSDIRHEVYQLHMLANKMCTRFSKLY
jgi:hypothetical protein